MEIHIHETISPIIGERISRALSITKYSWVCPCARRPSTGRGVDSYTVPIVVSSCVIPSSLVNLRFTPTTE
jgi:hypothetical protein